MQFAKSNKNVIFIDFPKLYKDFYLNILTFFILWNLNQCLLERKKNTSTPARLTSVCCFNLSWLNLNLEIICYFLIMVSCFSFYNLNYMSICFLNLSPTSSMTKEHIYCAHHCIIPDLYCINEHHINPQSSWYHVNQCLRLRKKHQKCKNNLR
jgi:hypothetical protein